MGEWLEAGTVQRGEKIGRVIDKVKHKIMYVLVAWRHSGLTGRRAGAWAVVGAPVILNTTMEWAPAIGGL